MTQCLFITKTRVLVTCSKFRHIGIINQSINQSEIFIARCYAERGHARVSHLSASLSVRLSVTFRYRGYIGWNTSNIISWPNSLRHLLTLVPKCAIWCNGNTPKIWVELGWGQKHTKAAISPKRCKRGPRLLLIGSCIRAFDWCQNQ